MKQLIAFLLLSLGLSAAAPPEIQRSYWTTNVIGPPSTAQFVTNGNTLSFANPYTATNGHFSGVANTFPSLTPSRFLVIDGAGTVGTAASSSDLFNTLLNPTGSGSAVFNTSPSFSTSVTLSYATASTVLMSSSGKNLISLANGAEGTVLGISNSLPAYVTAGGGANITNTYSTVIVTNLYSVSNNYTVGKGGKLTITNSITILTNGIITLSNLPSPAVLILNTDQAVTNAILSGLTLSGNTLTASGGTAVYLNGTSVSNPNFKDGAFTVWDTATTTNLSVRPVATVTTLTWSGTNLAGMDLAASKVFKITMTNNAFLASSTFANLPTTAQYGEWVLQILQDGTGGYTLNATNTVVRSPGGTFPGISTNANTISVLGFYTSAFTNSQLLVGPPIFGIQ